MLYLHGVGHFHPENELTNTFFEQLDIGTNEEWILERTGIQTRRTVLPLHYIIETRNRDVRLAREAAMYSNAELGCRAAQLAVAKAKIDLKDVGLIIGGGSVPDYGTPAEACSIAAGLNIDIPAIDLRSACTSFGATLWTLSMMQPDKLPPYILIVVTETVTRSVDYTDRGSAILWGDGAAAAVVSTQVPSRAKVLDTTFQSMPSGHEKVIVPWAGYFDQQGKAVQAFAIKTSVKLLREFQQKHPQQTGRPFYFIGHQANYRMLDSIIQRCNLEEHQHLYNVVEFGNTATAGSPAVISTNWDLLQRGADVALIGVGAGLSWTSALIRFDDN